MYFSSIPKVKDSEEENEAEIIEENKNLVHDSFNRIDPFMNKFFKLPIFKSTETEPLKELGCISETYKEYLERIKEKIKENSQLKNFAEENLV